MITPQNLVAHELCGLNVEVSSSTDKGRAGTRGTVVWETQHTLIVLTEEGEKIVPKRECIFTFFIPEKVQVDGKSIEFKPVERTKRGLKIMRRCK